MFEADEGAELEVERLAGHRVVRGKRQFLVQWKGYPVWESTWEPESGLGNCKQLLKEYKKAVCL